MRLVRPPGYPSGARGRVDRVDARVVAVVERTVHLRAGAENLRVTRVGDLYYPDRTWGDRYDMTEVRAEMSLG